MSKKQSVSAKRKPSANTNEYRTNRQFSRILCLVMGAVSVLVVGAMLINMIGVARTKSPSYEPVTPSQENLSMGSDTGKSMKNDMYEIGNNPTDVQREYFQQLTDALKTGDKEQIAEAVVYNFVSDYFTWTNKDGNYEVGGLQFIYGGKVAVFEQWSRYNFYGDLDLYIYQDGRDSLIEVSSVTTDKPTKKTVDFVTYDFKDYETRIDIPMECWEVNVSWDYANNGAYTGDFPNGGRFFVVDNNGRMEIAEFYDYESIHDWEATQGGASDDDE